MTRRGGHLDRANGSSVVWTIADGRRGRRWREVRTRDGAVEQVVLIETDRDGRLTRLEVSGAGGLLTLHPEPDHSAIHGNLVGTGGVRHLAFPWSAAHGVLVEGSPCSVAALAWHRPPGTVRVLRIDDDLVPRVDACDLATLGASPMPDGSPAGDGPSWPLELDGSAGVGQGRT